LSHRISPGAHCTICRSPCADVGVGQLQHPGSIFKDDPKLHKNLVLMVQLSPKYKVAARARPSPVK
jgi:hypothetical protein